MAVKPEAVVATRQRRSSPSHWHRKLSPEPARDVRLATARRGVGRVRTSPVFRLVLLASASLFISHLQTSAGADETSVHLRYRIVEESPAGALVGNVIADANLTGIYDAELLDRMRFRFLRRSTTPGFVVDPSTGVISTESPINRDAICPNADDCSLRLDVVVVQPVELFRIVRVDVEVADRNDNAPMFRQPEIELELLESAPVGTALSLPGADDPDSPQFAVRSYRLTNNGGGPFRLVFDRLRDGRVDPKLVLAHAVDREMTAEYRLIVEAVDGGSPPLSGSVIVVVHVVDANDNSPVFERQDYDVTIPENVPQMTTIARVRATDADDGENGRVTYSLGEATAAAYGQQFSVDADTGDVYVVAAAGVDRDRGGASVHRLIIEARDQGSDAVPATATVTVEVTDINDNAPEVTVDSLTGLIIPGGRTADAVVPENARVGAFVAHLSVEDVDEGEGGLFDCHLQVPDAAAEGIFQLQRLYDTEFALTTSATLDRENCDAYNLTVVCKDRGQPQMTSRRSLLIAVGDVNDHAPEFSRSLYIGELIENNYVGASVVQVTAVDADVGDNGRVTYALSGIGAGKFSVDIASGVITASERLDRETEARYSFHVVAVDAGTPPMSSSVLVVVDLQDVNDHRPVFHKPRGCTFEVAENLPDGTELGMVTAEDADSGTNGAVRYRLQGGPSSHLFQVDAATGTLSTRQRLDRESASTHVLSVVAYDGGMPPSSSSVIIRVNVLDVNDNPPLFRYPSQFNNSVHLSPDTPVGFIVTHLDAVDPDLGNNAHVTYAATFDPDTAASPFSVDPHSGAVIVDESLRQKDGEWFNVGVMATDDGGLAATSVLRLVVNSSSTFGLISAAPEASPPDRGTGLPTVRLMVVVGVVVGCGLLAVTLIVAIVVVRTQQSSKRTRHYNCRTAACVRLQQTTSPAWAGHAGIPMSVEVYTAKSHLGSPASPLNDKPAETTCSGGAAGDEHATSGSLRSSIYNGTWSSGSRQLDERYQLSPCCRSPSLDCASLTCLRYNYGQVRLQRNCGKMRRRTVHWAQDVYGRASIG